MIEKDGLYMNKGMTILYKVHNNLYVNLTNKCPCACVFCLRNTKDTVSEYDNSPLWLEREPTIDEVKAEFDKFNMDDYEELVFCGYGEPTERLDAILEIAAFVKEKFGKKIRINTNGMANLIWERDVTPDFKGLIDTVSISLNNPDPVKYQELVRCKFGDNSFNEMLKFARDVKKYVPNVVLTTVETTISKEEEDKCAAICEELGVKYRIRPWED